MRAKIYCILCCYTFVNKLIPANTPPLGRSLRHFRLAKISVRGDGNPRHLSIGFFFFFSFSSHHFGFSSYYPDEWAKTAMASRLSGSRHRAGNARKMKAYKAHFNPDSVQEWPAVIAKSHEGDTDAFCRLCRCDFSVSSGESKTYSDNSLIVTRCHH